MLLALAHSSTPGCPPELDKSSVGFRAAWRTAFRNITLGKHVLTRGGAVSCRIKREYKAKMWWRRTVCQSRGNTDGNIPLVKINISFDVFFFLYLVHKKTKDIASPWTGYTPFSLGVGEGLMEVIKYMCVYPFGGSWWSLVAMQFNQSAGRQPGWGQNCGYGTACDKQRPGGNWWRMFLCLLIAIRKLIHHSILASHGANLIVFHFILIFSLFSFRPRY